MFSAICATASSICASVGETARTAIDSATFSGNASGAIVEVVATKVSITVVGGEVLATWLVVVAGNVRIVVVVRLGGDIEDDELVVDGGNVVGGKEVDNSGNSIVAVVEVDTEVVVDNSVENVVVGSLGGKVLLVVVHGTSVVVVVVLVVVGSSVVVVVVAATVVVDSSVVVVDWFAGELLKDNSYETVQGRQISGS